MQNFRNALIITNLSIPLSPAVFQNVLTSLYPPSAGTFHPDAASLMVPLMPFTGHLRKWGTKVEVVVISETRWPSQGKGEEPANIENAKTYNTNLIKHGQVGTPKRPG
ncbi:hypothetical protein TB2_016910 [Malus domestica]